MPTTTEVKALFTQGVMNRVTYIRLLLDSMRPAGTPHAPHQISVQELAANYAIAPTELFTQLANMSRDGIIAGTLPNFTATWTDPNILTTYTPDQVIRLRAENMFRQKGYLFFCLGADNPSKTTSQLVNTARITDYYKLSMPDFFGELARLTGDRTLITDLDRITIQWLEYVVPVVAPTDNVSAALRQLNEAIAEVNSKVNSLLIEPSGGTEYKPIAAGIIDGMFEDEPEGFNIKSVGLYDEQPLYYQIFFESALTQPYWVQATASSADGDPVIVNVMETAPDFLCLKCSGINPSMPIPYVNELFVFVYPVLK